MNGKGRAGEEFAVRTLLELGYGIRAVNYHSVFGEVDIVAVHGESICFVEVKTRGRNAAVSGEQSVTRSKQRKIIRTALLYLQETECELQPRFDVFSVFTGTDGRITGWNHLKGAFDGEAYQND